MEIRKARKEDSKNITALSYCVWINTYATEGVRDHISEYVLSSFNESKIETIIDDEHVYIAEENKHILGYISLDSDRHQKYEIKNLYVLPRLQNKNIGRKLLEKAILRYNGNLWLTCWEKNTSALYFYKAMGFIEIGESFFKLGDELYRNLLFEFNT